MARKDWRRKRGERTWINKKTNEVIFITASTKVEMIGSGKKNPYTLTVKSGSRDLVNGVKLKTALRRARGYMGGN